MSVLTPFEQSLVSGALGVFGSEWRMTYFVIGLVMTAVDIAINYIYKRRRPTGDDVAGSFFANIFIWWAFLPWNCIKLFIAFCEFVGGPRNDEVERRHLALLSRLYERYREEAAALDIEPEPDSADWPAHWELVLRIQRAEKAVADLT